MIQALQLSNLTATTMAQAQDPIRTAPSPDAVGKFQALMQRADIAAPTSEGVDGPSALSRIVGTHDVQMEKLFNDMNSLQGRIDKMSPREVSVQTTELMSKMALLQMDTTVAGSFSTSTKGSLETLLKNQ